ncbi:hypothetical protein ACFE04_010613 [Oxalis oulophora]
MAWGDGHSSWVSGVASDSHWSISNSDGNGELVLYRFGSVNQGTNYRDRPGVIFGSDDQTVVPPTKFAQFAPAGEILDFMFAPAGEMLDSSSSEAAKLLHSFISSKSNPRLYVFNLKSN